MSGDPAIATGRQDRTVRLTLQWLALTVLLALGVLELAGGTGGMLASAQAPAGPVRNSVEDLARRIGCTADITADAADLRQGLCTTAGEEIWIATFPTDGAQQAWTTGAEAYGGSYLVGDRWVVVLSDTTADLLHQKLGGVITGGADHTGHHDPSGTG